MWFCFVLAVQNRIRHVINFDFLHYIFENINFDVSSSYLRRASAAFTELKSFNRVRLNKRSQDSEARRERKELGRANGFWWFGGKRREDSFPGKVKLWSETEWDKRREAGYHCKKNKEEDVIGQKVNSSWNKSKVVNTRKSDGEIGFEERKSNEI